MTASAAPPPRARRRLPADLPARIAVAVPAAAVLVLLIDLGGIAFAATLALLGVLAQWELSRLFGVPLPAALPGCVAVGAAPLLALDGGGGGLAAVL
ncbi:MAG: hypothetical protein AVDCRST_MAG30-4343, partial [uncultured Solirubrobacteraceae bacterium]